MYEGEKMNKKIPLIMGGVLLFTGCCKKLEWVSCDENCKTTSKTVVQKPIVKPAIKKMQLGNQICIIENGVKKNCIIRIEAKGVGVVPCEGACNTAEAKAMARRAAILDAYKALAEKMYGIKINGRDSVKNMILENSNIKAYVEGLISGANIEEENFKNGMYTVSMSVTIDVQKWNQFLQNMTDNHTIY
jgi:hypothetical protein